MNDFRLASARARILVAMFAAVAIVAMTVFSTKILGQEISLPSFTFMSIMLSSPPPADAQEELPGMGHKFELIGSAVDAQDPDNPTNDVISTVLGAAPTFDPPFGGAIRRLPPGIKIAAFDDQLNLKYRFTAPRTCVGGSPRLSLFVDANGDGRFDQMGVVPGGVDFVAQGHVNPPLFAGCPMGVWRIEDMADLLKRWETTPATALALPCGPVGGPTTCSWDELEMRVSGMWPNHQVFAGGLIDDTFGAPGQDGVAHYDLITIENRTTGHRAVKIDTRFVAGPNSYADARDG
jgi:hypothetical protein